MLLTRGRSLGLSVNKADRETATPSSFGSGRFFSFRRRESKPLSTLSLHLKLLMGMVMRSKGVSAESVALL